MTITEKFFVECVNCGIKGEKIIALPNDLDYKQLYRLCTAHSMSALVLTALEKVKDKLFDKFLSSLSHLASKQARKDIQSSYDLEKVLSIMEERGLKYMPLKGFYLKKLYPSSEMRYASDWDILIDKNQLKTLRNLTKELGLSVEKRDEHHDVMYNPETKTVFEFHKTLFVGKLEKYFGVGFEKAKLKEGYKGFYELSKEDFYITILAHSAYHFAENAGVGIRHLTDVYLYKKHYDLDYNYIDLELEKCNLLKFKNEFEKLALYFFENGEESEFTLKLAKHVIDSSILANEGKHSASLIASSTENGREKNAKGRTIFRKIFPTKENMAYSYPVLKKLMILLPIFYVVRWFHVLFTRPKNVKELAKISGANETEIALMKEIREGLNINSL